LATWEGCNSADAEQFQKAFLKFLPPWILWRIRELGTVRQFGWPTVAVHLGEAEEGLQPGTFVRMKWAAEQTGDEVGTGLVQDEAADFDHSAHGHGSEALQVQHPPKDEVGFWAGVAPGGGVACFESEPEQGAGVEGSVVVGVWRKDESMAECFLHVASP
jgi:hypothetical protein